MDETDKAKANETDEQVLPNEALDKLSGGYIFQNEEGEYAVIDWDGMDTWITACGSKADAIQEADRQWDQLTEKEKESRDAFFVGLINVQLTESKVYGGRFAWADDPDVCGTGSDVEEIAKDYKAPEESEEE